ncbi:MAG TPA: hypothetical protein VJS65_15145, partial [Verrucomicrobiae bacterium]|nr:hypothetical protein [Verrucomicrobiae bacterium]
MKPLHAQTFRAPGSEFCVRPTLGAGKAETRKPKLTLLALALLPLAFSFQPSVFSQELPLEQRPDATRHNLSSTNGLPLSSVRGTPPGSDGRAPVEPPGTTNQFSGLVEFGAVIKPASANLNPAQSFIANAENLNLPRIKVGGQVTMVMPRARVAAPVLSRSIAFLFGEIVPPPTSDEFGVALSVANTNVIPNRLAQSPETYWLAEPYSTGNHTNTGYYYSPHAQAVFAANPGPMRVAWRRSVTSTGANPSAGVATVLVLGVPYVVWTNQYVVSGSPVKDPRLMYWTERSFVDTGKPVTVPNARVGAVNVVYNNNFPERVANEVVIPGSAPVATSNTLAELRTLWFDETGGQSGGQIRAYNVEGRVFMELLGDVRGPGTRQHLGFEIVDVVRQPAPHDITIELGEKLTGYPGGRPSDAGLFPEPLFQFGQDFVFQHSPSGSPRPTYYATRETRNQNDLQVHWLEEGLEGLKWPFRFTRYKLVWPDDVAKYSHYIRPLVDTESEAKDTAVALPSQNAPFIAYQDPLDQPRGKLTENFAYYSFLDPGHPAHRALLRFTAGEFVRFERVFSWLDQSLRDKNLTLPNFTSGFTTAPAGATTYGNARVEGGILHLIDALNGQAGSYILNDFAGGASVESFRATFRARLGGSTSALPADGFSFNFGTLPNGHIPGGEEGTADGLAVSFDLFDNSGPDAAPGISIKRNGVQIAVVAMGGANGFADPPGTLPVPRDPATGMAMNLITGEDFVPVEIVLRRGGLMDVSYKGVKVLAGIPTGYTPRAGRFGFSARAGGANCTEWIDDLAVVVNDDAGVSGPAFVGSVATNLNSWVGNITFNWPDAAVRPRVISAPVFVGTRITAPVGETGNAPDTNYLAGFIRESEGNLYHPTAYVDPFVSGFDAANRGAIIPVNSIPGSDRLEVWWFRRNDVNVAQGFKNSFWPAVIGRYTVQWPTTPSEIVLASNDGSGPLPSLQATGSIYYQNDRSQPGYNPNEEHALLQGGQAFALRDDLNITSTNGYTSAPFVLVSYTEADKRPAVRPFKVLREKPALGITFDYTRTAGSILQPPMPLPLLEKPLAPNIAGQPPKSLNKEIDVSTVSSSTRTVAGSFTRHSLITTERHFLKRFESLALQNPRTPAAPVWFFPTNVGATTLDGWVSSLQPLALKPWGGNQNALVTRWRYAATSPAGLTAGPAPALLYDTAGASWQIIVTEVTAGYVEVQFATTTPAPAKNATTLVMAIAGPGVNAFVGYRLASEALSTAIAEAPLRDFYGKFTFQDRKGNTWFYRGYWMFKNANGALFGIGSQANHPWWVGIVVSGATLTPGPTFT